VNSRGITHFLQQRLLQVAGGIFAFAFLMSAAYAQPAKPADGYTGSAACKDCHESQYERWRTTRMANVVVDPKQHPEAVLGDFKTPQPHVPVHPAVGHGALQGSEPVHDVPSRPDDRERDGDDLEVARRVAVASATVIAVVHCGCYYLLGSRISSRKE